MCIQGHVARLEERTSTYRILMGKLEGKGTLGRHRRRWKGNIEMDLKGTDRDAMHCIDLAQNRDRRRALVNAVMNLRVAFKCWEILG
jgi:hypothetical protein